MFRFYRFRTLIIYELALKNWLLSRCRQLQGLLFSLSLWSICKRMRWDIKRDLHAVHDVPQRTIPEWMWRDVKRDLHAVCNMLERTIPERM